MGRETTTLVNVSRCFHLALGKRHPLNHGKLYRWCFLNPKKKKTWFENPTNLGELSLRGSQEFWINEHCFINPTYLNHQGHFPWHFQLHFQVSVVVASSGAKADGCWGIAAQLEHKWIMFLQGTSENAFKFWRQPPSLVCRVSWFQSLWQDKRT